MIDVGRSQYAIYHIPARLHNAATDGVGLRDEPVASDTPLIARTASRLDEKFDVAGGYIALARMILCSMLSLLARI